jgi:hypothetical protein
VGAVVAEGGGVEVGEGAAHPASERSVRTTVTTIRTGLFIVFSRKNRLDWAGDHIPIYILHKKLYILF